MMLENDSVTRLETEKDGRLSEAKDAETPTMNVTKM